ncbi:MAG: hypothetical protein ABI345_03125 [Jatrophihabitans sp.]
MAEIEGQRGFFRQGASPPVASPWPALDLTTVSSVIWTCAERERDHGVTPLLIADRAAEALAWSEAQALAWLDEQR